jgi:hypothetical protein
MNHVLKLMNTLWKCGLQEQKQFHSEGYARGKFVLVNQIHKQLKYFDYSVCSKYYERYNDTHYSETTKVTLQEKCKNYKHLVKCYIGTVKTNAFKNI